MLTLAAGQSMKDLDFNLIPQGVITGRVIDADGDPMPGLDVWVSSMNRFRGKSWLSLRGAGRTDDEAADSSPTFRPGTYYVSANDTQPRVRPQEIAGRPGRVLNRASSVITYYPASLDAAGATGLENPCRIQTPRNRHSNAPGACVLHSRSDDRRRHWESRYSEFDRPPQG